MKAYGGVVVWIHNSLTSALGGREWSASHPCLFTPGTHWVGGWVGPRAGLDGKYLTLPGLELQPVASRYTDYTIPAHRKCWQNSLKLNFMQFRSAVPEL
jgi:hypothetical protein